MWKFILSVLLSLGLMISQVNADDTAMTMADDIVNAIQAPVIPDTNFDIRDYGAIEGEDARVAIMKTIDTASKAGGGRVVIPAGHWLSNGPIHLKSKIDLHISEGATLLFSPKPEDYLPVVKTRWEGTEVYSFSPLIYGANIHDVAITGKGTLDGNAQSEFLPWYESAWPDVKKLREMGANGVSLEQRVFGQGTYLRPPLVQFFNAERVLLEDYKSVNSPFWVTHLVYTNHAHIRGIHIESLYGNNDGVDIESSSYVLVENSLFRTGDDSVVIKSGRDLDGRTIGIPSTHIVVRNNDMGGDDGIALGSEMSGGIKHVVFHDNVLREGGSAFRFKANLDRGGLVENIFVKNFRVERFKSLFWFQLNYPRQGEEKFPSIYRDIEFDNIIADHAEIVFEINAPVEQPLLDVTFKNITVNSYDTLFDVHNAKNITLDNFVVGDQRIDATMHWFQTENSDSQ